MYLTGTTTDNVGLVLSYGKNIITSGHKYYRINTKSNGLDMFNWYEIDDKSIVSASSNNTYLSLTIKKERTFNHTPFNPMITDLTQMFGSNEPTSVDDERIKLLDKYLEANPNYDEGTIKSANVESVVLGGANLLKIGGRTKAPTPTPSQSDASNPRNFSEDNYYVGITMNNYWYEYRIDKYEITNDSITLTPNQSGYGIGFPTRVEPNTQYTISQSTSGAIAFGFYDNDGRFISYTTITPFTTPNNCVWVVVVFRPSGEYTYKNIKLERGSVATPYTPYREPITKPISTIVSKYFPNGMKSAGSVYDEIDLVKGKAIQRVGSVDLGTLDWSKYDSANIPVYYARINAMKPSYAKSLCNKYIWELWTSLTSRVSGTLENHPSLNITYIADSNYDNAMAFKQAMNGVMLYYELATPTETPLEQADWEYLQSLEVESNGTITFANEQYLQVPNEESYLKRV